MVFTKMIYICVLANAKFIESEPLELEFHTARFLILEVDIDILLHLATNSHEIAAVDFSSTDLRRSHDILILTDKNNFLIFLLDCTVHELVKFGRPVWVFSLAITNFALPEVAPFRAHLNVRIHFTEILSVTNQVATNQFDSE